MEEFIPEKNPAETGTQPNVPKTADGESLLGILARLSHAGQNLRARGKESPLSSILYPDDDSEQAPDKVPE